jgi:hypothetical protein
MDDDALQEDPDRVALEGVIQVLTPLRQHRQARAERAQRQAQQALETGREQLAQARDELADETIRQVQQRQALATEHLNHAMTLTEVDRWHDKERTLLDHLSLLRQGIEQQRRAVLERQQAVLDAQHSAKAAQRATEKLACLAEAIADES